MKAIWSVLVSLILLTGCYEIVDDVPTITTESIGNSVLIEPVNKKGEVVGSYTVTFDGVINGAYCYSVVRNWGKDISYFAISICTNIIEGDGEITGGYIKLDLPDGSSSASICFKVGAGYPPTGTATVEVKAGSLPGFGTLPGPYCHDQGGIQ